MSLHEFLRAKVENLSELWSIKKCDEHRKNQRIVTLLGLEIEERAQAKQCRWMAFGSWKRQGDRFSHRATGKNTALPTLILDF